ncbi:MAG: hypothetical protein DBX62_08835 [Clostridia bacterium]|nr:MAG: hypothetical protein DBX62_08835 [Clostridia bacterium]
MNRQMKVFNHEQFGNVRIIEEDGRMLFCGSDVAKALGYTNPRKAVRDHTEGGTKRSMVSLTTNQYGVTTEQIVETTFITEGDVYRLITHSKLPSAERFERWVFDEVLPSIRRTGGYGQQLNMELVAQIITMTVQATVKELLPLIMQEKRPEPERREVQVAVNNRRPPVRGVSQFKIVSSGFAEVVIELSRQHKTNREIRDYLFEQGLEISEMSISRFRRKCALEPTVLTIAV